MVIVQAFLLVYDKFRVKLNRSFPLNHFLLRSYWFLSSPSEHFRVGLRYRWMKVEEMTLFTARDLHLAELSLGYVF